MSVVIHCEAAGCNICPADENGELKCNGPRKPIALVPTLIALAGWAAYFLLVCLAATA